MDFSLEKVLLYFIKFIIEVHKDLISDMEGFAYFQFSVT